MKNKLSILVALVITVASSLPALAVQPPPMRPWSNGQFSLNAPQGWEVNPRQTGRYHIVEIVRGSSWVALYKSHGNESAVQRLQDMIRSYPIQTNGNIPLKVSPDGMVALMEEAKVRINGLEHIGVGIAVRSTRGQPGVAAIFFARPLDFHLAGRIQLLAAVLGTAGERLMAMARSQPLPRLVGGRWSRVTQGAFAQRVRDGHVVGEDGSSSGTNIQFKQDGTYHLVYASYITTGMCQSRNNVQEAGRWSLQGDQLTLVPAAHDGSLCACCQPGQGGERVRGRGPARTYTVRSVQGDRENMILNGPCASFMIEPRCNGSRTWDIHYLR